MRALRERVLSAKVTDAEHKAVMRLAAASELSVSDYLQCIIQSAVEEGVTFNGRRRREGD